MIVIITAVAVATVVMVLIIPIWLQYFWGFVHHLLPHSALDAHMVSRNEYGPR